MTICGQPTPLGPCRYPAPACPLHTPETTQSSVRSPQSPSSAPSPHLSDIDSRRLARQALQQAFLGSASPLQAARLAYAIRALASLGPEPQDLIDAARETALRGRIMHGMPPRDPEQWALAATLYDDQALEEFRRWQAEWDNPPDDVPPPSLAARPP